MLNSFKNVVTSPKTTLQLLAAGTFAWAALGPSMAQLAYALEEEDRTRDAAGYYSVFTLDKDSIPKDEVLWIIEHTWIWWCKNIDEVKKAYEYGLPVTIYEEGCDTCACPTGDSPLDVTEQTRTGSVLNAADYNYIHYASDFAPAVGGAGCTTCTAGSAGGGLFSAPLNRIHRTRDHNMGGSFGIGGFHNYDQRVSFMETADGGVVARYFDPERRAPVMLKDGTGDDAVRDGVFGHDESWVSSAELLDAQGQVVSDFSQAQDFVIHCHNGNALTFEVAEPDAGG